MCKTVVFSTAAALTAIVLTSCSLTQNHKPTENSKPPVTSQPTSKDAAILSIVPVVPPVAPVITPGLGKWLVLGPIPCRADKNEFDRDFLAFASGESAARINPGMTLDAPGFNGLRQTLSPVELPSSDDTVDLGAKFPGNDRLAYAYTEYYATTAENAYIMFGSDDDAKVWINGKQVCEYHGSRSVRKDETQLVVPLVSGVNRILIKVANRMEGWGFAFQLLTESQNRQALEKLRQSRTIARFQQTKIVPSGWNRYVFKSGNPPELDWENPLFVETSVGTGKLQLRWFNARGEEVERPSTPGRYAAYLETNMPNGMKIRRAVTLFCAPPQWDPEGVDARALPELDSSGTVIDPKALAENRDAAAMYTGRYLTYSMNDNENGASLLAYLYELKPGETAKLTDPVNSPTVKNMEFQLLVKRKVLGMEKRFSKLLPPRPEPGLNAPVLRTGTEDQAGFEPGTAAQLHNLCQQWYAASQEPFSTLVARNGVIIYHEAFGGGRTVTIDSPMWIASISKLLTGMMFAQFVDQNLAAADDPLGRFLPDFPTVGPQAITFRNCFTHTTGLTGHRTFGGLYNPWLENVIANGRENLTPGKKLIYNGDGYNLAGKAMEMISGKSMPRLMQENFFAPLGMKNTFGDDLGGGFVSSSDDLAKVAQLLLNQGAYGNLRFFSQRTYQQLLPVQLERYYPGVKEPWGLGVLKMASIDRNPKGASAGQPIMGADTIGHGAASNAIFLVDPARKLIVIQVRNTAGAEYKHYREMLLQEIVGALR